MKKLLMILVLGLSLIGCYKLPPVGSVTINSDKTQEQTRLTEDVWKVKNLKNNKIEYSTVISLQNKNSLKVKYVILDVKYYLHSEYILFKIYDTNEVFINSLVINNSNDKVVLNTSPYDKTRLEIKKIYDTYDVFNHDQGNSVLFLKTKISKRLLKILESDKPINLELYCIDKTPVSYKISNKYKNALIDYLKIILKENSKR